MKYIWDIDISNATETDDIEPRQYYIANNVTFICNHSKMFLFSQINGRKQKKLLSTNVKISTLKKVSKGAKIRNRYKQVPHLTQYTNGKVKNSQLDTTNESQEVSPFPAGDHKAHINRRTQRHSKHKTDQKHKISTKEVPPWKGQ